MNPELRYQTTKLYTYRQIELHVNKTIANQPSKITLKVSSPKSSSTTHNHQKPNENPPRHATKPPPNLFTVLISSSPPRGDAREINTSAPAHTLALRFSIKRRIQTYDYRGEFAARGERYLSRGKFSQRMARLRPSSPTE